VGRFLGRKRKSPRSIGEKVSYRYPEKLHYPENKNCHYPTEEKQLTLREKKVIDFHTPEHRYLAERNSKTSSPNASKA
jgi:hypothetical protein